MCEGPYSSALLADEKYKTNMQYAKLLSVCAYVPGFMHATVLKHKYRDSTRLTVFKP